MKKILILIIVTFIIPGIVFGQLKKQNEPVDIKNEISRPALNNLYLFSFIDPSKLTMSHSYSMSFFSAGGKGLSQSLYLNTLKYQISDPLSLKVQWGVKNYPYNSLAKNNPLFNSGLFFSGAELTYRPSDKLFMKLQYNAQPWNNYYYGYPYRYRSNYFWDDDEEN
jgi:hypothetical protein